MKRIFFLSIVLMASVSLANPNTLKAQPVSNPMSSGKGQRLPASYKPSGTYSLNKTITGSASSGRFQSIKPFVKPPVASHASQLRSQPNDVRIETTLDQVTGIPIFIRAEIPNGKLLQPGMKSIDPEPVFEFLEYVKSPMHIEDPSREFAVTGFITDDLQQTHIRLQQKYKGVDVYGGDIILHAELGTIRRMNGRYFPTPYLDDVTPVYSSDNATALAFADLSSRTLVKDLDEKIKQVMDYEKVKSTLVIYHKDGRAENAALAWHLTLRPNMIERWEYFIDAKQGTILDLYNNTCADGPATASALDLSGQNRTINTFQLGSSFFMIDGSRPMFNANQSSLPNNPIGAIVTVDRLNSFGNNASFSHITSSNNSWSNPKAVSAHNNAALSYMYFLNTHSRNSINNQGGSIISFINVPEDNGAPLDNAFWNGAAMFYGNGNTLFSSPLAKSLDVAGHEMTHGVTENSAGLEYRNQSGALNESYSDVFGVLIERSNFRIGEGIVNTNFFPTGAMRDLSDPHNGGSGPSSLGWQPNHMNEFINTTQDNGGVHINSGIPNRAFFLFATATSLTVGERVYYRALTNYLTRTSQFIDLRVAVIQSATDLFGANSAEVTAARNAFDAVGITAGSGGGGNSGSTLSINPGDSYILFADAPIQSATTLYTTDSLISGFLPLSSTPMKSKPSVTDDGSMAYFVAMDGTLHQVELTSSPTESIIDNTPIWHNVAVSKDGRRLALNREAQDSSIVIIDLATGNGVVYKLFNPTSAQGEVVENVLFADALEWDYSNQYVMYDAFSSFQGTNGQSIDFWDVGFLDAWNTQTNTFGSGNIGKLFSNLPAGISIGNPTFSKNSPDVIAFDLVDNSSGTPEFSILGQNIQTSTTGSLFANNTLGWPNYSKMDNQLVFTSISTDTVIGIVNLQPDKINSNGNASVFLSQAKWPVWIAQGTRSLISVPEVTSSISQFLLYPNPASDNVMINYKSLTGGDITLRLYDLQGKEMGSWKFRQFSGQNSFEINVREYPAGLYYMQLKSETSVVTRKLLLTH